MKLLVIGSGMMGSAAAYDMARQTAVQSVTLADADLKRAREVAARINRLRGDKRVNAVPLDALPTRCRFMKANGLRTIPILNRCVEAMLLFRLAAAAIPAPNGID